VTADGERGGGEASVTRVAGVQVGHWTDAVGRTGCSVVLLPAGTVASGEIRGGAPGTREWALLSPERTVDRVNAVVLAGGSAFGLGACDGAVRWCVERGIGYPTPAGPVPIVVGMVVYDLMVGDPRAFPGPDEGYAACSSAPASGSSVGRGPVGAGTGATIAKWRGPGSGRPGGLGSAWSRHGEVVVAAMVVVNAIGEPREANAGTGPAPVRVPFQPVGASPLEATTIGVIVTNAALDKVGCLRLAQSGHDGLARALDPAHTGADGDGLVAAATGEVATPLEPVRALAAWVVEQAILDAVG
jgi:L-aminopeptidase/D-esterase-like protein